MAEINTYYQDLEQVADLLPMLSGNILVTGSTGLIGGCLVDLLMRQGFCKFIIIRKSAAVLRG